MTEDVKERKYWVYVIPTPASRREWKGAPAFTLGLLPFHYRKSPVHLKPFVFLLERSFASQSECCREAEWLFGPLAWKTLKSGQQIRATIHVVSRLVK
jgi:hypothetical protein